MRAHGGGRIVFFLHPSSQNEKMGKGGNAVSERERKRESVCVCVV